MKRHTQICGHTLAFTAIMLMSALAVPIWAKSDAETTADQVQKATGIKGGLLVHLGCGDGRLTAALHASGSSIVHGLDKHPDNVLRARKHLQSLGVYGPVSVERLSGNRLPYVDGLVNVVVAEEPDAVRMQEMMRVLAPGGKVCMKRDGKWTATQKPVPDAIDEWTHYLHDATNNAVAHDSVVGPPRRLQWVGSPRWARHHDRIASLNALVSASGRLFYVFDEGPTAAVMLPPKWTLVARDAFNGAILWKRHIPTWHPHLWPMKSGFAQLPRRLIAAGDRVYVTLGLEEPLTCLDAATGETVCTYDKTKSTEEVVFSDGVLFALVNESPIAHTSFNPAHKRMMWEAMRRAARGWAWDGAGRWLTAIRAETGEILWRNQHRIVPLSLAASKNRVCFHDGEAIVCLNRESGKSAWRSEPVGVRFPKGYFTGAKRKAEEVWEPGDLKSAFVPSSYAPTLVVHKDVIMFGGGDGQMTALSAETGKALWSAEHPPSGHFSPQDLFVIDDTVWSGAIALPQRFHSGALTGRDLHTGEVVSEIPCDTDVYFMHQRCYRSKATDRYFIPSRTGTEFISPKDKHWIIHHWVRGGCLYGVMPCNGLLYAPPHSCACYMLSKLNGFNALAPESKTRKQAESGGDEDRLERGADYEAAPPTATPAKDGEWPTYRHDPSRSGATQTSVTTDLKREWTVELKGKLSAPVIADGKVFVANVDSHTLSAIGAETGRIQWQFTAGGRIDSPPTIYRQRAFFGCADGWVYCVRSSDGALLWRYRAAPESKRLVAFEQLESVWPLHGSVLIQNGALYCVAGRSMFLDGGLRLLKIDPMTGRKLYERVLDENDPATGKNLQVHIMGHNMPVALPDVLSSDGEHLFMRTQQFDLEGNRQGIAPRSGSNIEEACLQSGEGMHLFCPIGFLDGSWWHRAYWVYGTRFACGAGGYPTAGRFAPAGRILVYDDSGVYGYGRRPAYYRWTTPLEYRLFGAEKQLKEKELPVGPMRKDKKRRRVPATESVTRWSEEIPLQARGMVLAEQTLFLAGPPDVVDEEKAFHRLTESEFQEGLARQSAALEGKEGAILWAASTSNGERLAAYKLPSPPVWDGMAAAYGKLFIASLDGKLTCLGNSGEPLAEARVEEPVFKMPELVGHWRFDEGEGVVAMDTSERCNDGTVHARWTEGRTGSALKFEDNDDRVDIPEAENLNITGQITIMAWIKPHDQVSRLPMIVTKLGHQGRYILRLDKERHLMALFWKGESHVAVIQSQEVVSKDWHHVSVTCDPVKTGKVRLYSDGRMVKEQAVSESWGNPAGGSVSMSGRGDQSFRGVIDEVRIYNRALPPEDIKKIAESE